MKKISSKIQDKINLISSLQNQLQAWNEKDEAEIQNLIKNFEKITRIEGSIFYTEYFSNEDFAETLLEIAQKYPNNQNLIIDIISSFGMMITRYHLKETEEIYSFILSYSSHKKISAYVAIYLPQLKGFENYPNKWEYYMSMRNMTPKKIAHQKFVAIIKQNTNKIPSEYKSKIIDFLKTKQESANNEFGKKMYLEMIEKIENKVKTFKKQI